MLPELRLEPPPSAAARRPPSRAALPPGPRRPPLLQSLRYVRQPYEAVEESGRRWGNCFTARALGQPPTVIFADPDAIKDIFMGDPDELRGGEGNAWVLGPILGWHSLLVLDGARHFRERKLLLPPFHGERIHVYGRIMQQITRRVVDTWPLGSPFPVHRELQAITLDVILRAVFGIDEGEELARLRACLLRLLALANGSAAAFLFIPALRIDLGRFSPWGRFVRDRRDFAAILLAAIARRRREGTAGRTDVLSMLIDARDEYGEPMRDEELLDEMFTLLMAGHETTATSLAWVLYHVLPRPDVFEKLRAELGRVLDGGAVEPEHVVKLEYLDAVIKESARLTPVATNVLRVLKAPARIGGLDLPAGVGVSASIYLTHHRPDLWPDPELFAPERFIGARPNPYTFLPFGGGDRRCLGAAFATYEMKVVLAELLARVDLQIAPGYRMRPVLRTVTVAPSAGMPVVVEARRPG